MLLVVFLLSDDDVAVDEDVVEQEKLTRLRSFAAHFREDAFADEDSAWDEQLFTGTTETALHHLYSSCIRLTIYYEVRDLLALVKSAKLHFVNISRTKYVKSN